MFYALRDAIFPREKGKMAFVEGFSLTKAIFPFSRGKDRISQSIEIGNEKGT